MYHIAARLPSRLGDKVEREQKRTGYYWQFGEHGCCKNGPKSSRILFGHLTCARDALRPQVSAQNKIGNLRGAEFELCDGLKSVSSNFE